METLRGVVPVLDAQWPSRSRDHVLWMEVWRLWQAHPPPLLGPAVSDRGCDLLTVKEVIGWRQDAVDGHQVA